MSVPRTDAKMEIVKKSRSILGSRESNTHFGSGGDPNSLAENGFTLIELLVVITIIVILMGLLFPAFRGVQDQAKKTQAKNDLTQIVTAVNAFYTEYGKYPITTQGDVKLPGDEAQENLMDAFACDGLERLIRAQLSFSHPPDVKDNLHPRSGIGTAIGNFMIRGATYI